MSVNPRYKNPIGTARQCTYWVTRGPAHRCAKVAKKGSDFCQHHEKMKDQERAANIAFGAQPELPEIVIVLRNITNALDYAIQALQPDDLFRPKCEKNLEAAKLLLERIGRR